MTLKMKVRVKLFGILNRIQKDNPSTRDMEVEIQDGACVLDLLVLLKIPESQTVVVSMNERIMKPDDKLPSGATVVVFQAVLGG